MVDDHSYHIPLQQAACLAGSMDQCDRTSYIRTTNDDRYDFLLVLFFHCIQATAFKLRISNGEGRYP